MRTFSSLFSIPSLSFLSIFLSLLLLPHSSLGAADHVVVEKISPIPEGAPKVTSDYRYRCMVTLYIKNEDGSRTPSGWTTRVSDGAEEDAPFEFQPGVRLIYGWTQGVLEMYEGERALIHVPASLGYGVRAMGSPGGKFYVPPNSDLLFDIEILGKVTAEL